jgi:hypothetical protein
MFFYFFFTFFKKHFNSNVNFFGGIGRNIFNVSNSYNNFDKLGSGYIFFFGARFFIFGILLVKEIKFIIDINSF